MLAVAPSRICRRGIRARLLLGPAVFCGVLAGASPAPAQDWAIFTPTAVVQERSPTASFQLPAQSANMKDALDEFQRMVKHEQWDEAFEALENISGKQTTGFVDRGDGVLVPSELLVRGLMAELPAAGKNAYRLFYDSQAEQLFQQAAGKAEEARLATIVADHLISTPGDRAADRLGDLYFERGDFERAAAAWQTILTYCPDSDIAKPQLLVKLATALARGGRWSEFRDVEKLVRERHRGEEVEIGGRRVAAVDELARLAATAESDQSAAGALLVDDFDLPARDEPLWRFAFDITQKPVRGVAARNPLQLVDVYGRVMPNESPIPCAADERRVYVNVFGVEMAFDLETGKLLWRSGKLHQLNLQQARHAAAPERYSIQVHGDRIWSVGRDPQQANRQGPFTLTVRDSASGNEVFSSRRSLSSWSILGEPLVAGQVAYVPAQRNRQGRDVSLLVLDTVDGKLRKTVQLGTYAVDQNQVYNQRTARPTIALRRNRVYVDTHAGAVAAIDPRDASVRWAVLYDSPPPPTGYYQNYIAPPCGTSGPLVAGGLVFAKGMSSPRLLGIAAEGPHVVWNRPVAESAVLVAADGERLYLGGPELTAYSLKTQELLWATQMPRSVDWSLPLVTVNRLYQFTSRGVCEVDKSSGDVVRIFRGDDLDSLGGALFVAGGKLITVSNEAITAYALDAAPREARAP